VKASENPIKGFRGNTSFMVWELILYGLDRESQYSTNGAPRKQSAWMSQLFRAHTRLIQHGVTETHEALSRLR
jgi:hypothetical protein